jgi:hypothetical protein
MRTSEEQNATTTAPETKARRRRAKRGVLATYLHEISPRHRRDEPVPEPAVVLLEPAPEPAPPAA